MVEDWALLDAVPEFTVRGGGSGSSETVATFWQQLTAATPALARKSAEEVELRAIELRARRKLESNGTAAVAAAAAAAMAAAGPSPQALEQWRRLEDGRFAGRLSPGGSSVAVAVELEGRLASGSEAAQTGGFVVALGGRIYELGEPAALAEPAATVAVAGGSSGLDGSGGGAAGGKASLGDGMLRVPWGGVMASSAAAMAGAAVLAGMVGFGAGLASSLSIESEQSQQLQQQQQQSPPPQMSTVTVYRSSSVDPKTFSTTSLPMLPPATPQQQQQQQSLDVPAKVPLTIAEQRKRQEIAISGQELRIEKEEMATARLDMRIKVDKQRLTEQKERLSELRRVEAEKGGDALFELPR